VPNNIRHIVPLNGARLVYGYIKYGIWIVLHWMYDSIFMGIIHIMKVNKYIIYGLIDPRDDALFYIGKSCDGTKQMRRHTQPWSLAGANSEKNNKIIDILTDDLEIVYIILDTAKSKRELEMKERIWIARHKNSLLNKKVG